MMDMFESRSLRDAIEEVEIGRVEGIECPCCGQYARIYKRKLNATMARGLIWLYRHGGREEFVHVTQIAPRYVVAHSGAVSTTRHWELVEEQLIRQENHLMSRTSGLWKLTQSGIEFVENRAWVPSHVHLYNNNTIGWETTKTNIEIALGDEFDYAELMRDTVDGIL